MIGRLALLAVAVGACAARTWAASPGFTEDFAADTGGFTGQSTVTHVASGGVGGAADPYIAISNASLANLGAASQAVELTGNLSASGVTGYAFWLRDSGANDDLEIHVGVGTAFSNFWLSVDGFRPQDGFWRRFTVSLRDETRWVQIHGSGTFQQALASSNRLLFRHDLPPLMQNPDLVVGDFGLDRISVLPVPLPLLPGWGRAALAALLLAAGGWAIARRPAAAPPP